MIKFISELVDALKTSEWLNTGSLLVKLVSKKFSKKRLVYVINNSGLNILIIQNLIRS